MNYRQDKVISPGATRAAILSQPTPGLKIPLIAFGDLLKPTFGLQETPVSKVLSLKIRKVKIALVGDSMTEYLGTAGNMIPKLKEFYPNYDFEVFNMGVGSSNIDYALWRITNSYEYRGQKFPSIIDAKADIVIVESFSYNQYDTDSGTLERYKNRLTEIVHLLEWHSPSKVLVMATIAPDRKNYAKGLQDLTVEAREKAVDEKNTYLQTALETAREINVPVVDAFGPSQGINGEGTQEFVEDETNIHPSSLGIGFMEKTMAESLVKSGVLNSSD